MTSKIEQVDRNMLRLKLNWLHEMIKDLQDRQWMEGFSVSRCEEITKLWDERNEVRRKLGIN